MILIATYLSLIYAVSIFLFKTFFCHMFDRLLVYRTLKAARDAIGIGPEAFDK